MTVATLPQGASWHYEAWANSNGLTAEEQFAADTRDDGSFAGHHFMIWISDQLGAFLAEMGWTRDQAAMKPERFTEWLCDKWSVAQ